MNEDKGPLIFELLYHSRFPSASVVCEIGAMDGADSIRLAMLFPDATIYTFEANPDTSAKAIENTASNPRIKVTPKAVSEQAGLVSFFKSNTANRGCSSLFKSSGKYDLIEPMPQTEVQVESVRLDRFMEQFSIQAIDALWLDAQGSELSILKSLGDKIASVRGVWTEFCYDELYAGQPLFPELKDWLCSKGFRLDWKRDVVKDASGKWWWGDALFMKDKPCV